MIQKVIPTIFAPSVEIYKKKLDLLSFSKSLHLDVCDGCFVNTKTFSLKYCSQKDFKNNLVQVHLMVKSPLDYLEDCIRLNIDMVLIHREIFFDFDEFLKVKFEFENSGIKVALVLNPETKIEDSLPYIAQVSDVMIMSVIPGAERQSFIEEVLDKVRQLKLVKPGIVIQIDGGVNLETGKRSLKAGVNTLSVGSFISSSKTPKKHFTQLMKL